MNHYCDNEHCGHQAVHHDNGGKCGEQITDLYGTWGCLCVQFLRDPDE